jgi:predicted aspartyl protease
MRATCFFLSAAFVAFYPAAAHAQSYDPTTLTATALLNKAHDARGTLAPGAYLETMTEHYGGVDYTVTTLEDGDDFRTTSEGGGFTTAYGAYHGQHWQSNENGVVTLRTEFRQASDPNELAFQHPGDSQYRVSVLGLTQTQPQEYVLDVNPPNGIDEHLYYNAQTFLLDREVRFERDRYQHVTDYADYRRTFGEMIPQHIHNYDGRPQNDFVETVVAYGPPTGPVDLQIPDSKALFALSGDAPLVLPATFSRDGIVIRAQIAGRGYDFLLDSGADGLTIDPRVVHELGLTPFGRSSATIGGGDVDVGNVRIPQMSIGPLQLRDVVFSTVPFDQSTDRNARLVGLMGFDFLASAITEIDFKAQTVTLYPRSTFTRNTVKTLGMRALAMQLDDGVPRVNASVENVPGNFLVDTGAFAMLAYKDFVRKLPSALVDPERTSIGTVGGDMSALVLHVNDFAFGGIMFRNAEFIEPVASTFDIMDYDGVIGRNALSVYQVYFDYTDRILFVKANI